MIRETLRRLFVALLLTIPSIVVAHPGHYHPPDEVDEFDKLRADWLHLHGYFEITLAALLVASILVFHFIKNRNIRIAAAVVFGGSLALLAAF